MDINTKLKTLRKQKGISQDEAAQCLGVSLSSYQKYEREKNSVTPSLDVLIKLAEFYGVTLDYLVGRETVSNPIQQLTQEEIERRLVSAYFNLPQQVRSEFLHGMAKELEKQQRAEVSACEGALDSSSEDETS